MNGTIRSARDSIKWHRQYGRQAPKRGEGATDFELRDVNGVNPVRLSDLRGKMPVVLIFGSFT